MPPRTESRPREVGRLDPSGARRWSRLLDCALVLGAIGGLLALSWFVLAAVWGLGLVSFATGSMAPRFPVGSIAVSEAVPLREVHVGDVVTVTRGARVLPITHRVVSIRLDAGATRATVHLQGDANAEPDPLTYRVTRLRRVIAPLPGLADWVRLGSSPIGVGLIAMLVAGAVVWALWPDGAAEGRS